MLEKNHVKYLEAEIDWLSRVIEARVKNPDMDFASMPPPAAERGTLYTDFITDHKLDAAERLLLILVMVPHLYPVFLYKKVNDTYLTNLPQHKARSEFQKHYFGVIKSPASESFLPTGQTFLYLVAGNDLATRAELIGSIYENRYSLVSENMVVPVQNNGYDPVLSNVLTISQRHVLAFTLNNPSFLTDAS